MTKLVDCLFCAATVGASRLVRHTVEQHMRTPPARLVRRVTEPCIAYWCWCGRSFASRFDACSRLKRHGGVTPHYLACHLGVEAESLDA